MPSCPRGVVVASYVGMRCTGANIAAPAALSWSSRIAGMHRGCAGTTLLMALPTVSTHTGEDIIPIAACYHRATQGCGTMHCESKRGTETGRVSMVNKSNRQSGWVQGVVGVRKRDKVAQERRSCVRAVGRGRRVCASLLGSRAMWSEPELLALVVLVPCDRDRCRDCACNVIAIPRPSGQSWTRVAFACMKTMC